MNNETAKLIKEGVVAAGTVGGGVYILYFQTIIGCIVGLAGATYSVVLTIKAFKDMKWNDMLGEAKIEDIKFRQERDLPVRRKSDEVVKGGTDG